MADSKKYVFDTGIFINLFHHYYTEAFPSLWDKFNRLIEQESILSVDEVFNEIMQGEDHLQKWAKKNRAIFKAPTIPEFKFIRKIFEIDRFQQNIRTKERLKGKAVADPFVIARAKMLNSNVVTTEKKKENAAKIPNICEHFSIPCLSMEEFMEKENWRF